MLKKAGESISKAFSKPEKSNVIKNGDGIYSDAAFETFGDSLDKFAVSDDEADSFKRSDAKKTGSNVLKAGTGVFRLQSFNDFEEMCAVSARTWGITNALYKDETDNTYYFVLQKGRCSEEKYRSLLNLLMEYGEFDSSKQERAAFVKEHFSVVINNNAINVVKKYM